MNKVILVGNLTRDPELTTTGTGISLTRFAIAVNRNYTNASGEREADFINIVVWRGLADNCAKYLTKGSKVGVCGSLQTRSYDDKDGVKRYSTEVVADDVEFLNTRPNGGDAAPSGGQTSKPSKKQVSELEPVGDEDLPF